MARYPLPTFEPNTEVPFAMRLAQFLLGASDQVQQYGANVEQQGATALRGIDSLERSEDRKAAIARQAQQDQYTNEDRDLARQQQAAQFAEKRRNTAQEEFNLKALGKFRGGLRPTEQDVPSELPATEMGAPNMPAGSTLPMILRQLVQPRVQDAMAGLDERELGALKVDDITKARALTGEDQEGKGGYNLGPEDIRYDAQNKPVARGMGRKPTPPGTASPGQGILQPDGTYKVQIPAEPKEPRAPVSEEAILGAAEEALRAKGITSPTRGQIQTESMNIRERLGKSSAPQINLSAGERDVNAKKENEEALGEEIKRLAEASPSAIGGMLGSTGRLNSIKMKFNAAPGEFAEIQKKTQVLRAMLINEMTGAAIGPHDEKLYLSMIPDASTNSDQEFYANLDATLGNIKRVRAIRERIQGGRTGGAKGGGVAGGTTAEDFIKRFVKP